MKERAPYQAHFEMLELPLEASYDEVHKAWLLMKEIYSTESLATMSIAEEVSEADRLQLLTRIEESYRVLSDFFREHQPPVDNSVLQLTSAITDYDGNALRTIRHLLHIPLDDVAMATRVPRKHLENIEADNYAALPVAVYIRGFVMSYAKHLALDAELVVKCYMDKYRKWQDEKGK
ncbi:MAG: helix-turn-helix domain-containing protein [Desulfobulbaceae bacterium]|nr:helix-turn-helix domain-containing protein [Desulfobulbaceae bacterium]